MNDSELLQYIHQTAEMGKSGIDAVSNQVRTDSLHQVLQAQYSEYDQLSTASGQMLAARGEFPKDVSPVAKISAELTSAVKTMTDDSPAKIAEMMIQGNTMGITKSLRSLHSYQGTDHKVRRLAEKLLSTEQANVEQMKQFL